MNLAAVHHVNWLEYREALPDGRLRVRLRAASADAIQVTLLHTGIYNPDRFAHRFLRSPMRPVADDGVHRWYEADYLPDDPRTCYLFELREGEEVRYFDQEGFKTQEDFFNPPLALNPFPHAYLYPEQGAPDWARGAVGYQIFPDRFRMAGEHGLPAPWPKQKVSNALRFGGDLKGIRQAVPYLQELGVRIVYLTPIFVSDTAHRYNIHDYYRIDPMLGSLEDLKALAGSLHERGMRLILDGVFNHSGTRFPPFMDAAEKGESSPYADWFFFDQSKIGYRTFAFEKRMPKLNLRNEETAAYFLEVGRYWVREAGIDGWRLDVSPEVWPDFWRRFRKAVRAENSEALLIAECWDISREWVSVGDMFDGTMHYILSRAIWRFFARGEGSLAAFDHAVNMAMMLYASRVNQAQWTFLSSHDTPRFLHRAGENPGRLRQAAFFQLTAPGVPIVYYGDELGMTGAGDPDCRRPMRWDLVKDNSLLAYYRRLIHLRSSLPALALGDFRTVRAADDGLYAYLRTGETPVLCALCTSEADFVTPLRLPEELSHAKALYNHLSGEKLTVHNGEVRLACAPGKGFILSAEQAG